MKISKYLSLSILLVLIIIVFRPILSLTPIAGGDYISLSQVNLSYFRFFPFSVWNPMINLGWGIIPLLGYAPYNFLYGFVGLLADNNLLFLERVLLWIPFLFISIFSSFRVEKKLFGNIPTLFLTPIIFLFNTYILTLVAGGQIAGIGFAYALIPLVLLMYINLLNTATLQNALLAGSVAALSFMFDIRITYIAFVSVGIYFILHTLYTWQTVGFKETKLYRLFWYYFRIGVVPITVVVLLHAFWLLPLLIFRQNPLQQLGFAYTTTTAVQFFSFAKFENALGLLHPNWPENIFGLTHFMQPEFIVLPILAFGSLLCIKKQKTDTNQQKMQEMYVVYFALLALIGIFLAKGANDPFGKVYLWMFSHVPGFLMFRDPTKWYMLVAVSYSILIPYTLWKLYEWIKSKKQFLVRSKFFNFQSVLIILFIVFWLFTIRQAVAEQLQGTLQVHTVPQEYRQLENFLSSQNGFSRTLWIPSIQRFGFYSINHPAVSAEDFFSTTSVSQSLKHLEQPDAEKLLQEAGVRFVIVPYDSEGELFVTNRKYDSKLYQITIASISALPWITKVNGFGRLAVFKIPQANGLFWILKQNGHQLSVSYTFESPTRYIVSLSNVHQGDKLIFSDSYSQNWVTIGRSVKSINSKPFNGRFNSFVLNSSGTYSLQVEYSVQRLVEFGLIISTCAFLCLISLFFFLFRNRTAKKRK